MSNPLQQLDPRIRPDSSVVPGSGSDEPVLTLLMLVTQRDHAIAHHAIRSFSKVWHADHPFAHRFRLLAYLNCLAPAAKPAFEDVRHDLPWLDIFDNAPGVAGRVFAKDDMILSPEGVARIREGPFENCDELWTRLLTRFPTTYVGTVDADFEVLAPDFFFWLLDSLERDDTLAGASVEHSPTQVRYETYSDQWVLLNERWHTWFCIYRTRCLRMVSSSHFYYEYRLKNGMLHAYDSAALVQEELVKKHGYRFCALPAEYHYSFIHYGASSKMKRDLSPQALRRYRRALLLSEKGLLRGHRWQRRRLARVVNKVIAATAARVTRDYRAQLSAGKSSY
jgi:hypothetical protein